MSFFTPQSSFLHHPHPGIKLFLFQIRNAYSCLILLVSAQFWTSSNFLTGLSGQFLPFYMWLPQISFDMTNLMMLHTPTLGSSELAPVHHANIICPVLRYHLVFTTVFQVYPVFKLFYFLPYMQWSSFLHAFTHSVPFVWNSFLFLVTQHRHIYLLDPIFSAFQIPCRWNNILLWFYSHL